MSHQHQHPQGDSRFSTGSQCNKRLEPRRVQRKQSRDEDWKRILELQGESRRSVRGGDACNDDSRFKEAMICQERRRRQEALVMSSLPQRWSNESDNTSNTMNSSSCGMNSSSTEPSSRSLRVREVDEGHCYRRRRRSSDASLLPRHEEVDLEDSFAYSTGQGQGMEGSMSHMSQSRFNDDDNRSHKSGRSARSNARHPRDVDVYLASGDNPNQRYTNPPEDDQSYHTTRTGMRSHNSSVERWEDDRSCYTARTWQGPPGRGPPRHYDRPTSRGDYYGDSRYHREPHYDDDRSYHSSPRNRMPPRQYSRDSNGAPRYSRSHTTPGVMPPRQYSRDSNGAPPYGRSHTTPGAMGHDTPRRYQDHHDMPPRNQDRYQDRHDSMPRHPHDMPPPRDYDRPRHYPDAEPPRRYDDRYHEDNYDRDYHDPPSISRRQTDYPPSYRRREPEEGRYSAYPDDQDYDRRHSAPTVQYQQQYPPQQPDPLRSSHHSSSASSAIPHHSQHSGQSTVTPDPIMEEKRRFYPQERMGRPGAFAMPPVDPRTMMEAKKKTREQEPPAPTMVMPAIPSESNRAKDQPNPVGPDDDIFIEIGAGVRSRLRRTKETMEAVANDFYVPATCMGCSSDLFCIADCQYIFCPACQSISPLQECETNNSMEGKEQVVRRKGVGLGFTYDTLFQMQAEIVSKQKGNN